jgi:LPS-assembly lipoprotein
MSLLDRRTLLLIPLALTACGFQPVYGPGGAGTALQGRVEVSEPDTRDAYLATRRIEERLGRASDPLYALALTVRSVEEGLAVNRQGNITRFNLLGEADYVLTDTRTGQIVTSGFVDNFTGYSATGTTVATLAAERDAQERLMTILADQIVTRLLTLDLA